MRDACCFVTLFHVIDYLLFPKRNVSQIPSLYSRVSLIRTLKYPTLHTNAYKIVDSMTPKCDSKWCETWPIRPITASNLSSHPIWATTFTISHAMTVLTSIATGETQQQCKMALTWKQKPKQHMAAFAMWRTLAPSFICPPTRYLPLNPNYIFFNGFSVASIIHN